MNLVVALFYGGYQARHAWALLSQEDASISPQFGSHKLFLVVGFGAFHDTFPPFVEKTTYLRPFVQVNFPFKEEKGLLL